METQSVIRTEIRKKSKWVILTGILSLLLGIVAMLYPENIGKISTVIIGAFLVTGGSIRILFSYLSTSIGSLLLRYLFALLMVIAGIYVISDPEMGLETLTLVIAIYFIVDGLTSIAYSFSLMPIGGGMFLLLSGIISGALGILVLVKWPESSNYFIGIYVGVKLFIDGMLLALTGYTIRKITGIDS